MSRSGCPTVLIAEDEPVSRRVLESKLRNWGYPFVSVDDGAQAWEILQKPDAPELLILDWMLPGIEGLELCRRVRANRGDLYQYVLLLSGKQEKEEIVQGLNAGADDYLTKPFDTHELQARLHTGMRILTLQHELIQAREALRYEATHDDLTGLWSRGATLYLFECELQRAMRSGTSTGVLMIDLDYFKKVNDTHGHLVGDAVLKEAANRVGQALRSYDFVGRYGGEEFLAVLSNCTAEELQHVAERARLAVAEKPIASPSGPISVTVSVGGAVTSRDCHDTSVLATADAALYDAKRQGRNRVVVGGGLVHCV